MDYIQTKLVIIHQVRKPNMDFPIWCLSTDMCIITQFVSYKSVLLDQLEFDT